MKQKITHYIRAGYAGLYLLSAEEQRVAAESQAIATDLGYHLHVWSATTGLLDTEKKTLRDCNDPLSALLAIHELPEKSLPVPAPQEGGLGGRAGQGQRHRLIQLDEGGVAQFGAGLGPAAWRDRWGGMVEVHEGTEVLEGQILGGLVQRLDEPPCWGVAAPGVE